MLLDAHLVNLWSGRLSVKHGFDHADPLSADSINVENLLTPCPRVSVLLRRTSVPIGLEGLALGPVPAFVYKADLDRAIVEYPN